MLTSTTQIFARKIIWPDPAATEMIKQGTVENHADNEIRIVMKLSKTEGHRNVVPILRHGWLEPQRSYFFDMERCLLTLGSFMFLEFKGRLGLKRYFGGNNILASLKLLGFWTIVQHITSGLNFIHQLEEVHRDLTPGNGIFPLYVFS
jgi:serine/threonine protein kinase